ncbi:hypothetical protein PMAYCL1PPCAC_27425, partial [Pristionchus mayeri]
INSQCLRQSAEGHCTMAHTNAGHGVSDIYRSVINDVIAQVKEAFLDESIDIDVLNSLKKEWEEKINQSGCVDMDPKPAPPMNSMRAVAASAGIPQQPMQLHRPQPQQIAHHQLQQVHVQQSTQQILRQQQQLIQQNQIREQQQLAQQQAQADAARQQQQLLQAQLQHQAQVQVQQQFQAVQALPLNMAGMQNMQAAGAYMQTGVGGGARVLPMQNYGGLAGIQGLTMPQNIMVLSGGQSISVPLSSLAPQQRMLVQQQMVQQAQQQAQQDHVHQLDGGGELRDDIPCSSASLKEMKMKKREKKKKATKPTRKEAEKVARHLGILQLDGGKGGGMSDSSSEEEEEEDEDPLRRMADRIGDDGEEAEADGANEDPLNSDDDQSDDEDLVTLFDAEDVVMCQFEKVSRARSKWKFSLKDGIMHINGKDFCFQKCTGEAEW